MTFRASTGLLIGTLIACEALLLRAPVARGAEPVVTPMGQLTPADKGRVVTVQGSVVGADSFSSGFKLTVNDGTGQLVALIWAGDFDHVYNSYRLNVGAVVKVMGKVDVYNGAIEVVPDRGGDVDVVKFAKRDARKYALGALTGNDHNAVVWVEGVVADITPAEDGAYLLVSDGTGAQKVKLYGVVAARIPGRDKLWVGQRVSVVGRVKARRRTGIEIVPALPHDVYILGDKPTGAK